MIDIDELIKFLEITGALFLGVAAVCLLVAEADAADAPAHRQPPPPTFDPPARYAFESRSEAEHAEGLHRAMISYEGRLSTEADRLLESVWSDGPAPEEK